MHQSFHRAMARARQAIDLDQIKARLAHLVPGLERAAPEPSGVLVANPPYGERIGSPEELAALYPKLGDALKKKFAGWNCFFFTADQRMAKLIRLQPSRRTPFRRA